RESGARSELGHHRPGPAWIKDEIGRAVGLPREIGGIPLDEIGATGLGLAAATEVAAELAEMPLKGARVVVQGFGAVGKHAARSLARHGTVLVGASDSKGTVSDPDGLDLEQLIALKAAGGSLLDHPRGAKGPPDAVIDPACEIWIPAARPDTIHRGNVERLK